MNNQKIYVVDTNVVIDYVDLVPEEGISPPLRDPSVELAGAKVVIPTAVIRELSKLKKEKFSDRGRGATIALDRLSQLAIKTGTDISRIYTIEHPLTLPTDTDYELVILPVHKNFARCLPFNPSDTDMDGQIILTTLTAIYLDNGKKADGTEREKVLRELDTSNVTLLTNDKGLINRAFARGVPMNHFRCSMPNEYIGRRDLAVPEEIYQQFMISKDKSIPREMWEEFMPLEEPLVPNEFIVMNCNGITHDPYGNTPERYWPNIGRYDQAEDAIVHLRYVSESPVKIPNPGTAIYIEALMDPDISMVICTGPAGTGKTFQATGCAIELCRQGRYIGIVVIPCAQNGAGTLPGGLNEKLDPDVKPIKNAIENYIIETDQDIKRRLANFNKKGKNCRGAEEDNTRDSNQQSEKSIVARLEDMVERTWENWFRNYHIDNARGRSFKHRFILLDEFQDHSLRQSDTLITRPDTKSKIVITGDVAQVHADYLDHNNNGIVYVCNLMKGAPMVARCHFTEDEVMRNPLVQWIIQQKAKRNQRWIDPERPDRDEHPRASQRK